jgi:glycosyltransferase involved in cell wall biosynthesis
LKILVKRIYKFALKNSNKVFFQNPDDKNYFIANSIVSEQKALVTFGLGVDVDHFNYVAPILQNKSCTFLLVARMLWDKGVGEFVQAAKILKKSCPDVKFQLLGKIDPDNPSHIPREKIEDWNNSGCIEYLGELYDVRPVIANASVVTLPSYYREGIPNSLMEAMAMGKPIITTNTPGCRETVISNINGLLIPSRNVGALVKAMQFMIADPQRRIEMGKEGRRIAVERFDVRRVNAILLEAMDISE